MKRGVALIMLAMFAMPTWAKTTATLDRTRVTQGDAVMLTIATDQVGAPDYSALRSRFRVEDVASERAVRYANGSLTVDLRDQGCLAPRLASELLAAHVRDPDLHWAVTPCPHAMPVFAHALPHSHAIRLHVTGAPPKIDPAD